MPPPRKEVPASNKPPCQISKFTISPLGLNRGLWECDNNELSVSIRYNNKVSVKKMRDPGKLLEFS